MQLCIEASKKSYLRMHAFFLHLPTRPFRRSSTCFQVEPCAIPIPQQRINNLIGIDYAKTRSERGYSPFPTRKL